MTPAVPTRFHFRLRLLTEREQEAVASRQPLPRPLHFANRPFRLVWGETTARAVSTNDALFAVEVPDSGAPSGVLEVGDVVGDELVPRLVVPVRRTAPLEPAPSPTDGERRARLLHEVRWRMRNLALVATDDDEELADAVQKIAFRYEIETGSQDLFGPWHTAGAAALAEERRLLSLLAELRARHDVG